MLLMCALAAAPVGMRAAERSETDHEANRYFRLGTLQFEQGKTKEAIEAIEKALKLNPHYGEAQYYLGFIYMQQSQPDQAIKALKRAIKINPYYTEARNQLGLAYRDQGKYKKAMTQFEAALDDKAYRAPEKIHLNVGYLHLKEGKPAEAIQSFQRALALNPNYLRGILGLAAAYKASGQADLAAKEYRRVVELGPDTPEAVEARQQLGARDTKRDGS
jgi:type IV pilus biogenesis/stability protein PilW